MKHDRQIKLRPGEWPYHEETVASNPNVFSCGIGDDAVRVTGMPSSQLGSLVMDHMDTLVDGGANVIMIHLQKGDVLLYVRRRKRLVDVGTRKDFEALGWGAICDALDDGVQNQQQ